eukprot:15166218-Heterocapsa_arctica.AAC.1
MAAGVAMRSRLISVWQWRAKYSMLSSTAKPGWSQTSAGACTPEAAAAAAASCRRSRSRRCRAR